MKSWSRKLMYLLTVLMLTGALFISITRRDSYAQEKDSATPTDPLPSPYDLISNINLACHHSSGDPLPVKRMTISHLNPVLKNMGLEDADILLGELEELCVPVAKDGSMPPWNVLLYIEWIDLACYHAENLEVQQSIDLDLSLLIPNAPPRNVKMNYLQQLCVPIAKNGVNPPWYVLWLVKHIDVACYQIKYDDVYQGYDLHMNHLNPVLIDMGVQSDDVFVKFPKKLCVPVAKNGVVPPEYALNYIQWMDFEKYKTEPTVVSDPITLTLSHLNPQFVSFDPFDIDMFSIDQMAFPVAKNGQFPPNQDN